MNIDRAQVLAALDPAIEYLTGEYGEDFLMVERLVKLREAIAALPAIPLDPSELPEGYEAVDHEALLSLIDRVKVEYPSDPPLDGNDERAGWHQGIKDLKYALARQNMIDNVIPISAREGVQLRGVLPVLETKEETP